MASPASDRTSNSPFPERVGRYELLLPLGTGGMATVYLASADGVGGFQREFALKLMHAHLRADEESKLHLLDEARLAARIRHPNVVPVVEVGEDEFGVYLVMDYVEGETLSGLLRAAKAAGETLSQRLIARIMHDALAGLHAAHELTDDKGNSISLVHRDFSPQNILVSVEGVTRLTDFGVAKASSRAVRTKTGLVKGKVSYMSPEQARGHAVDRRCDVWAAGVVVWELLAGRRLYDNQDDVSILLSVVTEEPPILSSVAEGVSEELEAAVAHALTSDVEERCPTAEQFRRKLEAAWKAGDGIADPSELSEFVKRIVTSDLEIRRRQAQRIRARRKEAAAPPPPASGVANKQDPDAEPADEVAPKKDSLPPEDTLPEGPLGLKQAQAAEPVLQTNTAVLAARETSRRRRMWVSTLAAFVIVGGAIAAFAWTQADAPQPAARTPVVEPAPPKVEVSTLQPDTELDEADPADEVAAEQPEDESINPAAPAATQVQRRAARPVAISRSTSKKASQQPKKKAPSTVASPISAPPAELAESPYATSGQHVKK